MKKVRDNLTFKTLVLFVYDIITLALSSVFGLLIIGVKDANEFVEKFKSNILYGIIAICVSVIIYFILKLYNSLWRYASIGEVIRLVVAAFVVFVINILMYVLTEAPSPRWSISFMFMQFLFACVSRFGYRLYKNIKQGNVLKLGINTIKDIKKKKVMIIGAGDAGVSIANEMLVSKTLNMNPVCFIDDDYRKINSYINGIKVMGNRDDVPEIAAKCYIDLIIVAVPSVDKRNLKHILNICKDTKCEIKYLPNTKALIEGENLLQSVKNVEISDLLGREQIEVNIDEIMGYIENRVIMVTGGGGSIGSELCRQIATHSPKQLIIFDIYENNAYEIEQELKRNLPQLNLLVLIGSVRDKGKLENVFKTYQPDIVFHAAAHKHVPLMETSPNEAIKNNVFGTLNCARMADKYGVDRFVLISTDKAVNPTNIMGASKRLCEMVVQTINKTSETEFIAVRFGNVLGSNGSVIPLFKKQIEKGGPVTVTHRDITRYFMTIPEAVSLVLQAGAFAKGGEIFVLDMGKPVKIYDLAENLIKLSGYTPNVDMHIQITGLRPGEKLYEELLMDEEGLAKTDNDLIYIGKPISLNEETFFNDLDKLYEAAYSETDEMKRIVSLLVPTYKYENK